LGYERDDLLKLTLYQVFAENPKVVDEYLGAIAETPALIIKECLQRKADGSSLKVSVKLTRHVLQNGPIYGLVVQDLGSQKQVEEALQFQVLHDPITGLPNRQFFEQQLAIALDHARHHQHLFAVLFFNLDSFKNINNSLGHRVGDRALKAFGQQIQGCIRSEDVLCRWGGDQFCVLLPQIRNTDDAVKLTQRLFEKLSHPIAIDAYEFHLKSSIGIAVYPQDGENSETLLKNADTALHRTKIAGRNHYQFYDPKLGAEATLILRVENLLDQAIARKQLSLHYQPQMNLKTQTITAMEALLRWENPEVGFISPAKLIPLAAKTDLIFQIGKWVLQTACEQNLAWQKEGLPPFPITVNFCSKEFHHPRLVETIAQVLAETGLDPHWLEIEVTEATLRVAPAKAKKTLEDIKSLGVRVALDDFGTGSSALGSLKYFPLNTLKIDQNFIRDLRNDSHDLAVISAILAMGRGFNLRIVAEGIENDYQLNIVRHLQCEEGQGYLLGRPLKVKDATQLLQEQFIKP
jgi:diguanylate cyclase (GGDEF)-like protein